MFDNKIYFLFSFEDSFFVHVQLYYRGREKNNIIQYFSDLFYCCWSIHRLSVSSPHLKGGYYLVVALPPSKNGREPDVPTTY
jgi:hypothetical protein